MRKLIVRCGANGFRIPPEVLEQLGITPGALVRIGVVLTEKEIQKKALVYTKEELGGGLVISRPRRKMGEWVVDLWSQDTREHRGVLYLDRTGEVMLPKSATRESVSRCAGSE